MSYRLCNSVLSALGESMQTDLSCGICRNFQWIRDLKAKIVSDASEHPASKFLSFCCTETFVLERRLYRLYRTQFLSFCLLFFFFFFFLFWIDPALLARRDIRVNGQLWSGLAWLMFNLDPNASLTASRDLTNSIFRWP